MEGLAAEMEDNAQRLYALANDYTDDRHDHIVDLSYAIAEAAKDFIEKPDKERGSVLSTARRHLKFLSGRAIKNVLSGKTNDFNLGDLKTKDGGMTIYLCLPPSKLGVCSGWLRLMISRIITTMERVEAHDPKTGAIINNTATGLQTVFMLDEFATSIGALNSLERAAGLCAGHPYHIKLWTVLQDLSQLKSLYPESWETFLGNSGILQFFANSDLTTLKWIKERCGVTSYKKTSQRAVSASAARQGDVGFSYDKASQDLITTEEASRYFAREDAMERQLIIKVGDFPWVLQRVRYYKKSGQDNNPVYEHFRPFIEE